MVDACAMHGIFPYYGPFGDIADVVACEDQFRNAFLLGCVGTWTLHPAQIAIAKKVFSPSAEDVAHARRVKEAMGDGTGAVMLDGKMEDDASLKQCLVILELADRLSRQRPRARRAVRRASPPRAGRRARERRPRPTGRDARCSTCRAATSAPSRRRRRLPVDGLILDLEDAVGPDHKDAARENACAAAASGAYGPREVTIRVNGSGTAWHDDDLAAACAAGPDGIVVPKVDSADEVRSLVAAMERHGAPGAHPALGDGRDAARRCSQSARSPRPSPRLAVLVMGTNDLVKELGARARAGPRAAADRPVAGPARRPGASGVAILDGVYNDVRDLDGFEAECRQGRDLGFDGKTLIHPGQVGAVQRGLRAVGRGGGGRPRALAAWEAGAGAGVVTPPREDGREPPRRDRPHG